MSALKPDTDDKHDLGSSALRWRNLFVHDIDIATNISTAGSFVFEGATANDFETTFGVTDPTADATINLPAMSAGTYHIPVLDTVSTTAISSTPAEINLLDAGTAGASVALATGDALIIGDATDGNASKKVLMSDVITLLEGASGLNSFGAAVSITDATAAASATTGALKVTGGISTQADLFVGDDLVLKSDSAKLVFGADEEVELVHTDGVGLHLNAGMRLAFRDQGDEYVTSASDGNLKINSGNVINLVGTTIDIDGIADVSGNLIVGGNLTVNGTTTTVDTENLNVQDKNILINDGGVDAASTRGAGLSIEHAGSGSAQVEGFIRVGESDETIFELRAPGNDFDLTLDINASKTLTVAGDLNIEADSAINQDLSSDSTAATFATLTLSTSLLPDASGGADIGSAAAEFGDIFIGDSKSLKLGEGQDVTITHDGSTGLNLDSAGGIDIDAGGAVAIDSTAGSITLGAALADGQTLKLGKNGAVETIIAPHGTAGNELYSVVNTSGTSEAAIALTASAGGLDLDAAATKDVNVAGGQVALVSKDDVASAISLTANVGSSETIVVTNTQGTAAGAIALTATAGGVDIDAAAAKDVNIAGGQVALVSKDDAASAISLTANQGTSETIVVTNTQGTAEGAITLTSTAGGVDINAAAGKDVDISGGQVLLTSAHNTASAIYLRANAGTDETIKVHADQGTSASSIQLLSDAGGVDIDAAAAKDVNIAGGQVALVSKDDAASAISLTANVGTSETIVVTNTQGTAEGAIALTASAGGLDLDAAAAKDVNIAGGQVALVSKDDAASAISLTANVGTDETIVITNTQGTTDGSDDAGAIELSAAAGGIGLAWADSKDLWAEGGRAIIVANEDAADAIKLHADAGTSQTISLLNDAGTAEGAIALTATAGGVDINAAADKDVDIAGGQVLLTSSHDTASSIYLRANAGTSETIKVHADQGTSESSIQLLSDAGGVDIDAAAAKDVNIAGGQVALVSKDDAASAISLTTNVGTSETITVTNTQGQGSGSISLSASDGGITLSATQSTRGIITLDSPDVTVSSSVSQKPVLTIKNSTNDANGASLKLVKDKGAAGAANDVAGLIEFFADDASQDQVKFGEIKSQVAVHTNGQEGGKLSLSVASHDGELQPGLILTDGDAEDEIDVTIGSGSSSLTTVSGALTVAGDLTVNGTTTTVNSTTLAVDDKNIELASVANITGQTATLSDSVATVTVADTTGYTVGATLTKTAGTGAFKVGGVRIKSVDSATQITVENDSGDAVHATSGGITFTVDASTDVVADGGGITLLGDTSKTFNWVKSTESWTSSENLDLANGKVIKHNENSLLSSTTLSNSITSLAGIQVDHNAGTATLGSGGAIGPDFGAIDNGTSNITTGGLLKIDVDGTAINAAGSLTLGAGNDAGLYVESDNLMIQNVTSNKDIQINVKCGGSQKSLVTLDASNTQTVIRSKLILSDDNDLDSKNDVIVFHAGETNTLDVEQGRIRARGGILVDKGSASTSNQDTSSGNFTSNRQGLTHVLTFDGALANSASESVTITNSKVEVDSVVMGSCNKNADIRIHTILDGSFICEITNKSGSDFDNDSTIKLNFVVM